MVKSKVIHFKKDCIGCGACIAINPKFWEMDEEGLAHLKGSVKINDQWVLKISTEEDRASNQEAADVCPVQIIKIEKEE